MCAGVTPGDNAPRATPHEMDSVRFGVGGRSCRFRLHTILRVVICDLTQLRSGASWRIPLHLANLAKHTDPLSSPPSIR